MKNLYEMALAANTHLAPKDVDIMVHHFPCNDGSAAALSALISPNKKVDMQFVGYDQRSVLNIDPLKGKNVLFADCAPTPEQYDELVKSGSKVLVLDHHKPAMDKLYKREGCFCSEQESAATMLWQYYNTEGMLIPKLFRLIRDQALSKKLYPESEYLYAGLQDVHPKLTAEDLKPYLEESKLENLLKIGRELGFQKNIAANASFTPMQKATFASFAGLAALSGAIGVGVVLASALGYGSSPKPPNP